MRDPGRGLVLAKGNNRIPKEKLAMAKVGGAASAVEAPGQHKKLCFVIAPIGAPDTETRKRSDQVLKHVLAKTLEPLGYTVLRADKISQPGLITLQVLEAGLTADLVVADLTDQNPNVFYELAVRHAIEKPIIHIIDSVQAIPFDVSDFRTIKFDYRDLERGPRDRRNSGTGERD